MEEFKNKWMWVVFVFKDGSRKHLYSTMSKKLLSEVNATLRKDYLFDLVTKSYVSIREDAVEVLFFNEKPEYQDEEVLNFASRFI